MNIRLKVFLILFNLISIVIVHYNVRNKKILLKYALIWVLSSVVLIVLTLMPNILQALANLMGFEVLSNMLFMVFIGINLLITFLLTTIVSNQKTKIINLTQEIGIIKEKLDEEKDK